MAKAELLSPFAVAARANYGVAPTPRPSWSRDRSSLAE